MKQRKLTACLVAMGVTGIVGVAWGQEAQRVERVEVTGSSIKRVQQEGPLPITVISREDITRSGITSAEQLVATLAANGLGTDNLSSQVGIMNGADRNNNGQSCANLRGLGCSSTLVLLNGRRITSHGLKGVAVDLNSVPLASVDRVEILRDGASAIYGTDAIGGVINFILKKNYQGFEASSAVDVTEQGGGNIYRASLVGGLGDLKTQGFNWLTTFAYSKQQKLTPDKRDFVNGYQPDRGISPDTTGTPFATQTGGANTALGASYRLTGDPQAYTRANLLNFQGKCDSYPEMSPYRVDLWGSANAALGKGCAYDYGGTSVLIQPVDNINIVSRGTVELSKSLTAFIEGVVTRSTSRKQFEPQQITTSIAAGNVYPVGGPYYQNLSAYIPTFDPTKPIAYRWRCLECGPRIIETVSDAYRALFGLEGTFGTWDYRMGLSHTSGKANSSIEDGYIYTSLFNAALATGKINPWLAPGQTQTAEAMALIESTKAKGVTIFGGQSSMSQFDATLSGEFGKLDGGPVGVAAGVDLRRESFNFRSDQASITLPGSTTTAGITGAPFDPVIPKASRDISAVFVEASLPLMKTLEAQLAVRHDKYSDFGGTTNPKLAMKFSPIKEFALRGSYSTGFRAPSLVQLYGPTIESQLPGNIADPVLCPLNPGNPVYCGVRPLGRTGGNPTLKPEEATIKLVGFVAAPTPWLSATVDMWEVIRTGRIFDLTPQQVVANYQQFPDNIVRNADGSINYIRAGLVNAAGDIARGTDVNLQMNTRLDTARLSATLNGTYIQSFKSRIFETQPYVESVGQWSSRDLYVRWKHNLSFTYSQGPWSGTLTQSYTHHYLDEKPLGTAPAGFNPYVKAYQIYHLIGTYSGVKNLTLAFGVKNLFNTDPPFTAHNVDFLAGAGWDPRVADPRGRSYVLGLTYKFF